MLYAYILHMLLLMYATYFRARIRTIKVEIYIDWQIKSGSAPSCQESVYADPGNNVEDIYSFLKSKEVKEIPESSIM